MQIKKQPINIIPHYDISIIIKSYFSFRRLYPYKHKIVKLVIIKLKKYEK